MAGTHWQPLLFNWRLLGGAFARGSSWGWKVGFFQRFAHSLYQQELEYEIEKDSHDSRHYRCCEHLYH